jgi:hypothetical protein
MNTITTDRLTTPTKDAPARVIGSKSVTTDNGIVVKTVDSHFMLNSDNEPFMEWVTITELLDNGLTKSYNDNKYLDGREDENKHTPNYTKGAWTVTLDEAELKNDKVKASFSGYNGNNWEDERECDYVEGGLWIAKGNLHDYDGVYSLPKGVADILEMFNITHI